MLFESKADEIDPAERRDVARRYRDQRTRELREAAERAVGHPVQAAGTFHSKLSILFKLIPVFGWITAARHRGRAKRLGVPQFMLLALDEKHVHVVDSRPPGGDGAGGLMASWPRSSVTVTSVTPAGSDHRISLAIAGEGEVELYATSLRTNPWSAEVVRMLGGEVPDAIDPTAEPAHDAA